MNGPQNTAIESQTDGLPDLGNPEIDLDDMTDEIARTLLACEELAGPKIEQRTECKDEPSWGGVGWWFRAR